MANALVQFRIDDSIRQQASDLCAQLGFDLSTYLRMSLNKLVQERGVPFNLKLNTVPTAEEAIARIERAEASLNDPTKWVTSEQMWADMHQKFPWLR